MGTMNGTTQRRDDPNAILNSCRDINAGVDEIESNVEKLKNLVLAIENLTSPDQQKAHLEEFSSAAGSITTLFRNLVQRMSKIKADPASVDPKIEKKVGATDRRLKASYYQYLQADADCRKRLQEQKIREYMTIRPDASQAEVMEAVEDSSSTNMFQQAVSTTTPFTIVPITNFRSSCKAIVVARRRLLWGRRRLAIRQFRRWNKP